MLSELSPELNMLIDKETLHFYNDYPHKENLPIWHKLFFEYPDSIESIEARWRRAFRLAGMEQFSFASQLIDQGLEMIAKQSIKTDSAPTDETGKIFRKPQTTIITEFELKKIKRKLEYLRNLISSENLGSDDKTRQLLAQFILLNPHDPFFKLHLDNLLQQAGEESPIVDNILLSQTMLIPDAVLREQRLGQLADNYPVADGGIQAKFEQACLKLSIWKEHSLSDTEKEKYLAEAKEDLGNFLKNHPDSIFAEQAGEKLSTLPVH
jgi:tetratricopeptide (TPR) repeat protein